MQTTYQQWSQIFWQNCGIWYRKIFPGGLWSISRYDLESIVERL